MQFAHELSLQRRSKLLQIFKHDSADAQTNWSNTHTCAQYVMCAKKLHQTALHTTKRFAEFSVYAHFVWDDGWKVNETKNEEIFNLSSPKTLPPSQDYLDPNLINWFSRPKTPDRNMSDRKVTDRKLRERDQTGETQASGHESTLET
jgi:hypothetical protein